jgi:zinc transport system substrate-binding protein
MAQEAPDVIASIKPVHSLVAGVMGEVGAPDLLVRGGASPHGFTLRPSDARRLEQADLVLWVGPQLETFLPRTLDTLSGDAMQIRLIDAEGLALWPVREGGAWEGHAHDHSSEHADDDHDHDHSSEHAGDDHDHDHSSEHADDDHDHGHGDDHDHETADHAHDDGHDDDHAHGEAAEAGHDHAHDDGQGHDAALDGHIWLDPDNARAMVTAIADALGSVDPANADTYAANAQALDAEIAALDGDLAARLAPVADRPFVVFHDAYRALEEHYGLNAVGSITVSPELRPGAARLVEIRERIAALDAVCVFAEPQFPPDLVDTVTEGLDARSGTLDPLGAELEPGTGLYADLMSGLARDLVACLSPTG